MGALGQDLRYGCRMLLKTPAFTSIAILCLALGIGANTAIFSVVDAVLLKPLPYANPDQLVFVWEKPPDGGRNGISAATFLDWRNQNQVLSGLAGRARATFSLTDTAEPEQIPGDHVSANYFALLGVKPSLGRTFLPEEEVFGKDKVVVLSDKLWKRRFASDQTILNQSITLDGEKYTVIGIMGADTNFDRTFSELWTPLAFNPKEINRGFHFLGAIGRLKPGVTLAQAQVNMDTIAHNISEQYPATNKGWGVTINKMNDFIVQPELRQTVLILLGAVGFILLIACANVANLMLARAATRQREVSIRGALGASRRRILTQFLTESLLLALAGGVLGVILAYWLVQGLLAMMPAGTLPAEAGVAVDHRVLFFTLGISLLTGIAFGAAPAWQAARMDLNESLKEGGRAGSGGGRHRLRSGLVIAEVALALMLLVGSGLLIRSFLRLQQVDPGFNPHNVLTMGVALPAKRYQTADQIKAFYRESVDRLAALPGVEHAALCQTLPLQGYNFGEPFNIAGRPKLANAERPAAAFQMVSADYFKVMGIHVNRGRGFAESDTRDSTHVAVINEALARRYFKDEEPIGKSLMIEPLIPGKQDVGPTEPWEIVGVIKDVKQSGLSESAVSEIYLPYTQCVWSYTELVLRTTTDPLTFMRQAAAVIHGIDKDQPLIQVRSMDQVLSESVAQERFRTLLMGSFALLALILSCTGIYGVMSYAVTQRSHEIGIRMALGAQRSHVLRMVVQQGMLLTIVGVGIGVGAALALTRLLSVLSTLIFGISATDFPTFSGVSVLLMLVALIACLLPARRATRVDPMIALRHE